MSESLAAIVLCAGKGTRMKSEKAKVLHPILGRPLCAYPISRAFELGASPVVAVVGHQAEQVESALGEEFQNKALLFALQAEQRGTADAVRAAQKALSNHRGRVLILYGDTPLLRRETLANLCRAQQEKKAVLAVVTIFPENPTGYGRVVRKNGKVERVVEQKDCSPAEQNIGECNAGIYSVDSQFLWDALGKVNSANAQAEFYLTDLVAMAAQSDALVAVEADFDEAAGVNDRAELSACAKKIQERINLAHMRSGVTLHDPATTFIEESVRLEPDVEIEPLVSLRRGSRVARGARIGQGSILMESDIGVGTQIRAYCVLEQATVGQQCLIGPFARLRPESRLADGVHIGNFVETKKTTLGNHSKANHLSYLGDADIGAGVNVGAGTITCNYDGKNKFKTVLEDNVFVGSDTQLVAPIRVGQGAYIGAGTTLTRDVPAMSLALSRSPQMVKEGWVARKKAKESAENASGKIKSKPG